MSERSLGMMPPLITVSSTHAVTKAVSVGGASWTAGSFAANGGAIAGLVAAGAALLTYISFQFANWAKHRTAEIEAAQTKAKLDSEIERANRAEEKASKYEDRYFELLERLGMPARKDD